MKTKEQQNAITNELINCNEDCPAGTIKVEVRDPNTGKVIGCKCVPIQESSKLVSSEHNVFTDK